MSLPLWAPVYRAGVRDQPALQQATTELEIRLVECAVLQAHLRRPSYALRDATGARSLGAVCVDHCPVQMQKASWDAPREEGAREEGWAALRCVAAACRMRQKHRIK
jgi:hypothetical protein